MLKESQKDNILMFPKSKKYQEIGSVALAVMENGEVQLESDGLSLKELRAALGFAIHLAYEGD